MLAQYDVFAFPTWEREPFGVAPLEAAFQGCVPLVSRSCGIAEWLVDGVHCLKVERTAEAFARALGDILDGKVALAPLARRARAVIGRDFHLDAIVPKIERALEQAARLPRHDARGPAEAYRLAILAERSARVLAYETLCA